MTFTGLSGSKAKKALSPPAELVQSDSVMPEDPRPILAILTEELSC